jgi:tetratricopeptide (TPR) repeat protein
MRRFDRLEFENPQETQAAAQTRPRQQTDHDDRHWMNLADENRRLGLYESSLKYYSRALEVDKSLVAAWVGQVQMLIMLGEFPEAELWSRKALELFKNNAELMAARAQALCRTGDLKEAQAMCDAALAQQGQSAYPWLARGEVMVARKEQIDEYCFDKAIAFDRDWLLLVEIAAIYLHYQRAAKALKRCREAVEKAPDQVLCWYRQALCELALDMPIAARKSFMRCLQVHPNHADAKAQLELMNQNESTVWGAVRKMFKWS